MSSESLQIQQLLERVVAPAKLHGGVQIGVITSDGVSGHAVGVADVASKTKLAPSTLLEICSLSKTLAAAFAIDFFESRGIGLSTSANAVLARFQSPIRLVDDDSVDGSQGWADKVLLRHLISHRALGMHYVYGTKLADAAATTVLDVIAKGKATVVSKCPGAGFAYSGG
jgi:CubicO group peptidase (beta-lactamase class C family)